MAALLLTSGCADIGFPKQASYFAPLNGTFNESSEFTAELAFLVDYEEQTFEGVLQNFRFPQQGFENPDGQIRISGTASRGPGSTPMIKGGGSGVLRQGRYALSVNEFEIESDYFEGTLAISGWYFGGGDFTEMADWERYVGWYSLTGTFQSDRVCATSALNPTGCGLARPPQ